MAKLRNMKKIFFIKHPLLISGKIFHWLQRSYHLIPGDIPSLTFVFNIIFIASIKYHNWKNVSCFLMIFCLKLLFEDMRFWAILDKACVVGKFVNSTYLKILFLHFLHKSWEIFPPQETPWQPVFHIWQVLQKHLPIFFPGCWATF